MMALAKRASAEEIFAHLRALLGEEAVNTARRVSQLGIDGNSEAALDALRSYDEQLGGVGLHWFNEKRVLGVYRAFYYVLLPFRTGFPQEFSRDIVYCSGTYLEELIKRMVRLNLIERFQDSGAEGLPLGALVRKLRRKSQCHPTLIKELEWLAQRVHNFAKHKFNFEFEEDEQPDHYFGLDEAIAIYFIARKLGLELESLSGKSTDELCRERS